MPDPALPPGFVAVVTGAGGGLGSEVAQLLSRSGLSIACVDVDADAVHRTASAITEAGGKAAAYALDLTVDGAAELLKKYVNDQLGHVSHLLNIAGILHRAGVRDTDVDTWRRVLEVNLTAPFQLTRIFAEDLRTAPYGRVVNCASISSLVGYPFTAYAASKAGLANLTSSSLFEFWGTQVTVNAVAPGAMITPMLDLTVVKVMAEKTPSGSIVTARQVADVIEFLSSERASGINGMTLPVDGGATAVYSYT
ncbi:SDR family oxidoreductase [Rhodococcus fascians]|nr:SDR family oxidoreductase [Rhodococcus fascians]